MSIATAKGRAGVRSYRLLFPASSHLCFYKKIVLDFIMLSAKREIIDTISSGIPVIDRQRVNIRQTALLITDLQVLSALLDRKLSLTERLGKGNQITAFTADELVIAECAVKDIIIKTGAAKEQIVSFASLQDIIVLRSHKNVTGISRILFSYDRPCSGLKMIGLIIQIKTAVSKLEIDLIIIQTERIESIL